MKFNKKYCKKRPDFFKKYKGIKNGHKLNKIKGRRHIESTQYNIIHSLRAEQEDKQ